MRGVTKFLGYRVFEVLSKEPSVLPPIPSSLIVLKKEFKKIGTFRKGDLHFLLLIFDALKPQQNLLFLVV